MVCERNNGAVVVPRIAGAILHRDRRKCTTT